MATPRGLGKGLGALLDDTAVKHIEQGHAEQFLPVKSLIPSTVQPRRVFEEDALKSLSASIKSQGVLQPLLVRAVAGGKYEIIAGERRWRASQLAGLTEVPVVVRQLDDSKALEVAIVENVQRADLNPIDEASGYLRLVNEFNYTHEEMARVIGKSRSHITNLMRLLALPERIKEDVSKNLLTMGHARALLGISDNEDLQGKLAAKVIKHELSVRDTEKLVRNYIDPKKRRKGQEADPQRLEIEESMTEALGLKVAILPKEAGQSWVRISFADNTQLALIYKKLTGKNMNTEIAPESSAESKPARVATPPHRPAVN